MKKHLSITLGLILILCITQSIFGATFTVTKTDDTNDGNCDADCSLREAIAAATGAATDDLIVFDVLFNSPQVITLSSGELTITSNGTLAINGPGADLLAINGNNASRILFNDTGAVTTVSGFTFINGNGVGVVNTGRGGAIYNRGGNLTVSNSIITLNNTTNGGGANAAGNATTKYDNCVFSGNTSTGAGGGLQNFSGSNLTIRNSSIYGNESGSTITGGGAAQLNGTVVIENSTISNNLATDSGGAFYYNGQGLIMNNVTVAGNVSTNDGGGIHKATSLLNAFLRNTLIAENNGAAASTDITGTFISNGNNLIETVGTSTGWVASDITNQPALLSPLGFYGGNGFSHIPLSGSPALNMGNNCVTDLSCSSENPSAALTTDQRGATRPSDTTVDIGAVEADGGYIAILPPGSTGVPYFELITPDSGSFSYTVNSGSLPDGIDLITILPAKAKLGFTTIALQGNPTSAGSSDFGILINNGVNSATVNYQLSINTIAPVSVGGRTFDSSGNPVGKIVLTISDGGGAIQTTTSNQFGYFRFDNILPFQTYTITANSKQYLFSPQTVPVNGEITNLSFMATSLTLYQSKAKK